MVPASTPFVLDTNTVNLLMPGISAYYGKNLPVNVHFQVQRLGDFTVKAANQ